MHLHRHLMAIFDAQRGSLFAWLPVCFAIGIGVFFAQKNEPSLGVLLGMAALACVAAVGAVWWRFLIWGPLLCAMAMAAGGFATAGWRTHDVAAPVLDWRYYGPVEGRVVGLDRSSSDAVRVTLDRVKLSRMAPKDIPARVRVSLHGAASDGATPNPGARIMTTAHLSPPGGPVEPGGFDFQRHSWFNQLGAVGYSRVPLVTVAPKGAESWAMRIFEIRMAVSRYVQKHLPGDVGGFGAAVTSGDRSGIGQGALQDLRASNLAHLLAISGLHMGLLTGFVFSVLRVCLVLVPWVALYWPTRRLAAAGALIAATVYFALSGGNVSTERAYIMAAVALCAVMLDRRAISLRSVAIAALVVLVLRPEALMGPGFQMSFAATAALVAVFNAVRDSPWHMPWVLRPVMGVLMSSAVAGLATAPFAAAHFNAVSHYGLLANVLSVPVMGIIVVPAAVLAGCLWCVGLAPFGLIVMGWGLSWILFIAEFVAALPGARSFVVGPNAFVLPAITLGAMMLIAAQGRVRLIGVVPICAAFVVWSMAERPQILIAETGGLVGIMTQEGRALSKPRGAGFVAKNWLENDGDNSAQAFANARWEDMWPKSQAQVGDRHIIHVTGKKAAATPPSCDAGILVSNAKLPKMPDDCEVFDPNRLKQSGAVSLSWDKTGALRIKTARDVAGDRLWSGWPESRYDQ